MEDRVAETEEPAIEHISSASSRYVCRATELTILIYIMQFSGICSHQNESHDHSLKNQPNHLAAVVGEIPSQLFELEVVDMSNDRMDPLEWMARKLIPIPKVYYWELEGREDQALDSRTLPWKLTLWHRSVAALVRVVRVTDHIGLGIARFLGLTASRFENVTSTMTPADWEYSRREVAERRRLRRQNQVEEAIYGRRVSNDD